MKRIPRFLATMLIFGLLNVGYIDMAFANSPRSSKGVSVTRGSIPAPVSKSVPDDDPCVPKVTKKCIENDLDQTQTDFQNLKGPAGGFADTFFTEAGFDLTEDIADAKTDLGNLTDADVDNNNFNKLHKKFKKRHEHIAAILSNPSLVAILHRPAPVKFRVVVTSASGGVLPGNEKAFLLSTTAQEMNRSFPSLKSAAARGGFAKGLNGLNVVVVPELDGTCKTGDGVPGGVNAVFIAKTVAFLAEAVKEAIPDDTATVLPHGIAVVAWALAKGAEILLDGAHAVYMECKTIKDGDKVDSDLESIKSSISTSNSTLTSINTNVTNIKDTVNNDIKPTVNNIKTTVDGINSHTDTVGNTIITKINTLDGKADVTNNAVNVVGTNVTTINNTVNTINNNVNTVSTNLNVVSTKVDNVNTNVDNSRTLIINNANVNAANNLRLLIEADLATPDSSTPLAIFETPASKGGYLELARTIVFDTIKNLTGATTAQANATLASVDSLIASGKWKAAYAALRKAYKSAAN